MYEVPGGRPPPVPRTLPTLRKNPSINKPSSNVYSAQQPAFPVEMSQAETVTASLSKATSSGTPKKNKASINPLEKCLNTYRSNRSVKKRISKAGKKLVTSSFDIHADLKIRLFDSLL